MLKQKITFRIVFRAKVDVCPSDIYPDIVASTLDIRLTYNSNQTSSTANIQDSIAGFVIKM
jgi:hypothetical protein